MLEAASEALAVALAGRSAAKTWAVPWLSALLLFLARAALFPDTAQALLRRPDTIDALAALCLAAAVPEATRRAAVFLLRNL
jgi:hypothetical protein